MPVALEQPLDPCLYQLGQPGFAYLFEFRMLCLPFHFPIREPFWSNGSLGVSRIVLAVSVFRLSIIAWGVLCFRLSMHGSTEANCGLWPEDYLVKNKTIRLVYRGKFRHTIRSIA